MGIFCLFVLVVILVSASGNKSGGNRTHRNTSASNKAYYGRMGAKLGRRVGRMKW